MFAECNDVVLHTFFSPLLLHRERFFILNRKCEDQLEDDSRCQLTVRGSCGPFVDHSCRCISNVSRAKAERKTPFRVRGCSQISKGMLGLFSFMFIHSLYLFHLYVPRSIVRQVLLSLYSTVHTRTSAFVHL